MKKHLFFSLCFLFLLAPLAHAGIAGISREAFQDVPRDAYYYHAVEKLVTMNLVIDVDQFSEDEYFYPGKPLTRAEFIWWTVQLFGLDGQTPENPIQLPDVQSFSDVPKTHPLYSYIEIAKKYRLIAGTSTSDGKPTGRFEPNKLLSRAEAAVILSKAFPEIKIDSRRANPFSDIESVPWANNAIYKAYKLGFFSGYPNKTFRPGNSILRAEGITVLSKVFDKLKMATLSLEYTDIKELVEFERYGGNCPDDYGGHLCRYIVVIYNDGNTKDVEPVYDKTAKRYVIRFTDRKPISQNELNDLINKINEENLDNVKQRKSEYCPPDYDASAIKYTIYKNGTKEVLDSCEYVLDQPLFKTIDQIIAGFN